jgi:tetratricopeptide (TPR) repeat protein
MTARDLLAALGLALLLGAPAGVASAQNVPQPAEDEEPIDLEALAKERQAALLRPDAMSYRVRRYLSKAGEEMADGNLAEAKRLLLRLNPDRLSPFERANVYRLLAYVHYQLSEEREALVAFEKAIAEQALLLRDDVGIMFNVVQLHAALEEWDQVIEALDRWQRYVPAPTGLSYYLRAVAYYQLERYDDAIAAINKAVALKDEPEESWYQLQAALYVLKEDYASVTPVLETLVTRFPKKTYWVQLSLIYGAREKYERSLAVQQLAYMQGFLTEDNELQRLARSYVFAGLPYDAALVLEKGLESGAIEADSKAYEFLANSWIQAREFDRSLAPLRKAAQLSEGGDLYVRLGQVHMAREEWSEAAELFRKAIEKGDLQNPGNAYLLLGISYYNDNRVDPAKASFAQARRHEKSRKPADDWLAHIEKESQSG